MSNFFNGGSGNSTATFASGGVTNNTIPKSNGSSQLADSSITDDGTKVATAEIIQGGSFQVGTSPILTGPASATWQFGAADAAAPVAQKLSFQSVVAGTTNTVGTSPTIRMSLGTGNAIPKPLIITGPNVLGSGSTQQTETTRLALIHTTANLISNNTATLFVRPNLVTPSTLSLIIRYTVEVNDGTNTQVETGMVSINAVTNNAGTQTLGTPTKFGNVQAVSSGTLAVSFTSTTNGGAVDIKITSNSSLTPTLHRGIFEILNMSGVNSIALF